MAKAITSELGAHLDLEVTTLARCWKIVRKDGVSFFFTSFDKDLEIDGDAYVSTSGFQNTAVQSRSDLSVDNLEIAGVFDDDSITLEDLRAGMFDYADVYIFLVNWADLTQGKLKLRRGKLGECTSSPQGWFNAEMRGLTQLLAQNVTELYGPECAADLFDTRCKLLETAFVSTGHVTAVTDELTITVTLDTTQGSTDTDDWFKYGLLQFTSGDNNGKALDVKSWNHTTGVVVLYLPAGYAVAVSDTFKMWPGCDKSSTTCKVKFNNLLNFRGFPYLPGSDQVFNYPDAKS